MVMVMVVVVMVVVVVVVVLLLSWRGAGDSWCMVAGLLRFLMSCLDPLGSSCLSHRKRGPWCDLDRSHRSSSISARVLGKRHMIQDKRINRCFTVARLTHPVFSMSSSSSVFTQTQTSRSRPTTTPNRSDTTRGSRPVFGTERGSLLDGCSGKWPSSAPASAASQWRVWWWSQNIHSWVWAYIQGPSTHEDAKLLKAW